MKVTKFFSPALNKQTNYSVILPERGEGPFPVLLQLHGLTDNHRSWLLRSSLDRHVEAYPFIVVLPDGVGGPAISSSATSVATRECQSSASRIACFSAGSKGHSIASAFTNVSGGAVITERQSALRSRLER